MNAPPVPTQAGPETDLRQALEVIERALDLARVGGAEEAEASVGIASGFSATVRLGEVDTLEHERDRRLGITVYSGHRKGSASTSDLSPGAVAAAVDAALAVARHTQPDPCAGLVERELLAREVPDLDLWHPIGLDPGRAIDLAVRCEAAARGHDPRISNSEGAGVRWSDGVQAYGNSHGFTGGWPATRLSLDCTVIAGSGDGMQRDGWYSVARREADLDDAEALGRRAAERTLARLGARKVPTCEVPVVFEAPVATSLISHFVGAISGGSLYRRTSFLLDRLDSAVFPPGFHIREEPWLPRALGSAPFDGDGVAPSARDLVADGVLRGYVLGGYSARRLGMRTTGNAGGVHNLLIAHGPDDLAALLRRMGRGLLVTDLMGFGVNAVTGDYSRGAAGFWVEDGAIAHPVEEITIAGNLKDMYLAIDGVGSDVERRGKVHTGSLLIGRMTVAGS